MDDLLTACAAGPHRDAARVPFVAFKLYPGQRNANLPRLDALLRPQLDLDIWHSRLDLQASVWRSVITFQADTRLARLDSQGFGQSGSSSSSGRCARGSLKRRRSSARPRWQIR